MELQVAHAHKQAFLGVLDVARRFGRLYDFGKRLVRVFDRGRVRKQRFAVGRFQREREFRFLCFGGNFDCFNEGLVGRDVDFLREDFFAFERKRKLRAVGFFGRERAEQHFPAAEQIHVDCRAFRAFLDAADVAQPVPVLREIFDFVGGNPSIVGLVVGIRALHKLDVVPRGVGEDFRGPARICAPQPEFSALYDVVVADEHCARLAPVVVARDEVVFEVVDENRVVRRVVFPPRDVEVVFVFLLARVGFARNRPVAEAFLAVEGAEFRVLRKYNLVVFIDVCRDVRPVENGVVVHRCVGETSADFDVRLVGVQRNPDCPRHSVTQFGFAQPHGFATVGVRGYGVAYGHVRRRAVVVEDVPFNAARNPCARHADVRGLDYVLMVEDVVAVRFVYGVEKPAADFGQYAELDVLVFEVHRVVRHVLSDARHVVVEAVRIDAAAGALVRPVAVEYRRLLRGVERICRDCRCLLPRLHRVGEKRDCRLRREDGAEYCCCLFHMMFLRVKVFAFRKRNTQFYHRRGLRSNSQKQHLFLK